MGVRQVVKRFGRPAPGSYGGGGRIFDSAAWLTVWLVVWPVVCLAVWLAVWAALFVGRPSMASEPIRILMLGDSLTAGYGLIKSETLPVRLQAALEKTAPGIRVINGGVSGDTTAGGRARLAWSLAERPDAVIIALGANDGLRGLAPELTYANLNAMIRTAKDAGVRVLLAGMRAPPNLGTEYGSAFDAVFPRLAAEHGVVFYPFLLQGVVARRRFNQDDGIHPNAQGVDIIVGNMLPLVGDLIARLGH